MKVFGTQFLINQFLVFLYAITSIFFLNFKKVVTIDVNSMNQQRHDVTKQTKHGFS
jgi:hypothetical protein